MSKIKQTMKKSGKVSESLQQKEGSKELLFRMSHSPDLNQSTHWFQMLLIAFFVSAIVMITRMAIYSRPMAQFFWSGEKSSDLPDFFSYYKMAAILACAVLALTILLYRVFTQSLYVKRSYAYIPILVYSALVLLSYAFSDYKEFALFGWNERFEGTLTLLGYMVMLFFIINSVHSEKDVKWVVYPLAGTSALLGLLGLTQALGRDFFQTTFGKKLITPSWFWDQIDSLKFTFQNREIYQTVYNINYVSFYLTLLIPLFGLLFIRSVMLGKGEPVWKKISWGALFTLLIYNLIGSASSGGLMGMGVVVLVALIVLNKRILAWRMPVVILIALTVLVAGISYERWMPELSSAIKSVLGTQAGQSSSKGPGVGVDNAAAADANNQKVKHKLDYIVTSGDAIVISLEGNEITFTTFLDDPASLRVLDATGEKLSLIPTKVAPIYQVDDERFKWISVRPAQDDNGNNYIIVGTDGKEWPFRITEEGVKYITGLNKAIDLRKVPAVGWENNQGFGSGRGYIWSRTIPMMKDTILLGHGADTYSIYFPQDDYVGKYNSPNYGNKIDIVVDKPHNMYFGVMIGTGVLSILALLTLWGIYIVQSFRLYRKENYDSFIAFVGSGIFLGICGFLISGLVNDSTVSVMPMFYGLLGTGVAINTLLLKVNGVKK